MHQISDGERRRVQLVMGLMSPWDVLLLDEVRRIGRYPSLRITYVTDDGIPFS